MKFSAGCVLTKQGMAVLADCELTNQSVDVSELYFLG